MCDDPQAGLAGIIAQQGGSKASGRWGVDTTVSERTCPAGAGPPRQATIPPQSWPTRSKVAIFNGVGQRQDVVDQGRSMA